MGQCCSGDSEEEAKESQPKVAQMEYPPVKKEEPKKVSMTVNPKNKTITSKRGEGGVGKEEKEEAVGRRPSSLQVKNIHYIKSASGYRVRKQIPQPVKSSSMTAAATISASERIAHRKMATGPAPKVAVDMKRIIENLREKQTMRNQVAMIGGGGRSPSTSLVTGFPKSAFKSAISGQPETRRLKSSKKSSGAIGDLRSSSCSLSGCSPEKRNFSRSKSQLSTSRSGGSNKRSSNIGPSNSSACGSCLSYSPELQSKSDLSKKKSHTRNKLPKNSMVTSRSKTKSSLVKKET